MAGSALLTKARASVSCDHPQREGEFVRTFTDRGGKGWQVVEKGGGGIGATGAHRVLPVPQTWLLVFHSGDGEEVGVPAEYGTLARLSDDELRARLESNPRRRAD